VVSRQPLGTNFSVGAAAGSAIGNVLATVPARVAATLAGTAVGTSVSFGSRSLTVVTPTVERAASTAKAIVEGSLGGIFEAGGQEIESQLFPSSAPMPAPSIPGGVGVGGRANTK
jgi:hypothetical protein